jgi:hypothetical protein
MEDTQQNQEMPTTMNVGLRYGLILSLISILYSLVLVAVGSNPFDQGWKGYISFVFVIGVVVYAHKYFKENGDGFMSYGQGFGIAFITILVSIVMGGIFSYVYSSYIDPAALDAVWEKSLQRMEEQGQSEEAIEMAMEWTKKLFWVFYLIGGIFSGTIIGLIIPIFTQKKRPEITF